MVSFPTPLQGVGKGINHKVFRVVRRHHQDRLLVAAAVQLADGGDPVRAGQHYVHQITSEHSAR